MRHQANSAYWQLYRRLPGHARKAADKDFALLVTNPRHPSLQLKKIGDLWSVRAGLKYRALGIDLPDGSAGILWFWIGKHAVYDRMIKGS